MQALGARSSASLSAKPALPRAVLAPRRGAAANVPVQAALSTRMTRAQSGRQRLGAAVILTDGGGS